MKLKIKKINLDLFKDFLEKLVKFDQNLFIKISPTKTTSTIFFENRDAVKYSEYNTNDLFEFEKPLMEEIKIAFYNSKEIITALSFFTSDNIEGEIDYTKDNNGNYASRFVIKNDVENFSLFCLDKGLSFVDMTDDELKNTMMTTELNSLDVNNKKLYEWVCFASFRLDNDTIKKMESRLRIGKKENKFTLKVTDNVVTMETNNNTLQLSDNATIESTELDEVVLFKKYLNLLDKENYNVFLCSNKIIFSSLVSDTKLAIAVLPEDERDLEDFEEDMNDLDDLNDLAF